jgi:hypothetical protein
MPRQGLHGKHLLRKGRLQSWFSSNPTMQQELCKRPIQNSYRRDQRKNVTTVMPHSKN